jgi:hypothetical protein
MKGWWAAGLMVGRRFRMVLVEGCEGGEGKGE